jgi:hypothetical protein
MYAPRATPYDRPPTKRATSKRLREEIIYGKLMGWSNRAIAYRLRIRRQTVPFVLSLPDVQARITQLRAAMAKVRRDRLQREAAANRDALAARSAAPAAPPTPDSATLKQLRDLIKIVVGETGTSPATAEHLSTTTARDTSGRQDSHAS